MAVEPKYHWTFEELSDSATTDVISGATARLSNVKLTKGRIGNAIALNGSNDSYISLGREIGQFGREDFTVAFGVKIAKMPTGYVYSELFGNRATGLGGNGNFFFIGAAPDQVMTMVDEDSSGKNSIWINNSSGWIGRNSGIDDDTWHHIAVVRQQNELRIYIDGRLSGSGSSSDVAIIANGNELRTGSPNPDDHADPKAEFEDLRIYDRALSDQEVAALVPSSKPEDEIAMSMRPKYHWTFDKIDFSPENGPLARAIDPISLVPVMLFNAGWGGKGRIGNAIALNGSDDSSFVLDDSALRKVGQFGQEDFTVAFGVKIAKTSQHVGLLGNRTSNSHDNFFCIRVTSEGHITAEIDEDSNAKNYIWVSSAPGLDDNIWHHLTVVRQQKELKLYIDGELAESKTANGVANINNNNMLMTGNTNPDLLNQILAAPKAEFEDLRIYDYALSDQGVADLVPPLKQGELELTVSSSTAGRSVSRIWASDVADLSSVAPAFDRLRLGANTGVTLYQNINFGGTSQKVTANLPNLSETRLGTSPQSIKIWSTVGQRFSGYWNILAPNAQYLSVVYFPLTTSPLATSFERFFFRGNADAEELVPLTRQWLDPGGVPTNAGIESLFAVNEESFRRFSLMNKQRDRWLKLVPDNRIALRSYGGKYLRADNQTNNLGDIVTEQKVFADASYLARDGVFHLIPLGDQKVALKLADRDHYLTAKNGGGSDLIAAKKQDNWQTFTLEMISDSQIALKSLNGQYVCAEGGGGREVVVNRSRRDIWETFEKFELGGFDWTTNRDERAIFTRSIQCAEYESQLGELLPREVAFYEHPAYWGRAWVMYDSCPDFRAVEGLNDTVSSIQLGPETGATLYAHPEYGAGLPSQDRKNDIEGIVASIPNLSNSQIGNDKLSSARIWPNIPPRQANISLSVSMSQDYRLMAGTEDLQEFSSYRTILKFLPEVTQVEIRATDLIQIEVDGELYTVDEERCVDQAGQEIIFSPNGMHRLMLTSEAEGISTPGLTIRTNTMQPNERVVIFPDREVHRKLADLEHGALWNATVMVPDPNNPQGQKEEELVKRVASMGDQEHQVNMVQQTITEMMNMVNYMTSEREDAEQIVDREMAAHTMQPRGFHFSDPTPVEETEIAPVQITEMAMDQRQFVEMMDTVKSQGSAPLAQSWKNIWRQIKNAIKGAATVVVGVINRAVHVIVAPFKQIGDAIKEAFEDAVSWVIDTAEKVGAFVEGVVEKIGVAVKRFVDYLRNLFNWGDIISTQRYLAESVELGLNYTDQLVGAARTTVKGFLTNLSTTVDEELEQIIARYDNDKSNIGARPNLPEPLEWFLSKLTSGSKAMAEQSSQSPPENDFLTKLFKRSEEVVGLVLVGIAGLGATLAELIRNPTHPQVVLVALLRTVQRVTQKLFQVLEGLVDDFLNAIAGAVAGFRTLITADINIPFVKGLFKLIGIDRFNLLNTVSLLLAIPVTITSKLFFGKKPFEGEPRLSLSTQDSIRGWAVTGFIADTVNGLITGLLDATYLENVGFEVISTGLSFFSWMSGFPDSTDFDGGRPYNLVNHPVSVNSEEYWGRVMWGWRTFVLGVNVIVLATTKSRLKRAFKADVETIGDKTKPILAMLFGAIDLGITAKYLTVSMGDAADHSAEYVGLFPSFFAFLNYKGPLAKVALGVIDVAAAAVVAGLRGDELRREF
jgi:hypothetical protein